MLGAKRALKMKKISSKIMFAIISCSIIIALLLGSASILQSSKYIKKEVDDKLLFMSESYANEFSQTFKIVEASINTLKADESTEFDLDQFKSDISYIEEYTEKVDPVIKRIAEATDGVEGVYFVLDDALLGEKRWIWYADAEGDGTFIRQGQSSTELYSTANQNMHWYYGPSEENRGIWSKPYLEPVFDINIISYSEAIFVDDVLIGVIGMDIKIDDIKNTIENMKVYDTGYAFLFDENYNVLIHPSLSTETNLKTMENGQFKFITEHMDKNQSGVVEYKLRGKDKVLGYAHLSNGWIIGFAPPIDEIFQPLNELKAILIILTLLGIVLSIIASIIFSNRFFNPLSSAVKQLKFMELGDFTQEISKELLNREDDLGTFIRAVDSMQKVIIELMEKVKNPSDTIANSPKFLVEVKEQTQIATNQVTTAIEQIVKNTEEEAINKKILEQTIAHEKIKNEFFSNISHELKTPLNIIFSATQLLSTYTDNHKETVDISEINKHISYIKQNCYRLLRLINNLIDMTKIDSDSMVLNLENKNIVEIIENITLSTIEYVESKSKTLIFDTDVEEKIMAFDSDSIERIMLNLISNAIKFTNPKDKIEINIYDKDEKVFISVKDTGIGIPKEKQEIIFDRFKQVDTSLSRRSEGSGIGLSLVKSLVEMHEGSISINSKSGEGTEFIIELPVKQISEECKIQKNNSIPQSKVEKIQIEFSDIYA